MYLKKRAIKFIAKMIDLGIDKKRPVLKDGGVRDIENQENRTVVFKIISNDYEPKNLH